MRKGTRIGLGVLVLILIIAIFSIETILAGLRQRNLDVRLVLADSAGATITMPTVTPIPRVTANPRTPTVTPTPAVLLAVRSAGLAPDGTVRVEISWNYRIGPTFPKTIIRAEAISEQGLFVAVSQYVVDCGTASVECRGAHLLALENGVKEGKGQRIDWKPGDYQIRVSQRVAGLASQEVLLERVTVSAP